MANNFDVSDLQKRLKQMSDQVGQFNAQINKIQQDANTPPTATEPVQQPQVSTYPRVFRSDTVEDILENPDWKQQLAAEFSTSESAAKAKQFTDTLFLEFCEKQTGKQSIQLNEVRKNNQQAIQASEKKQKSTLPKAETSIETKVNPT